jgi:hypothetical protein
MPKQRKAAIAQRPNGPMAAALVGAGLGCATLGALTIWAEASPEVAEALNWWPPAGPLSGKAGAASGVFLSSWLVLHLAWRKRNVPYGPMVAASATLLTAGLLGTFPPVFQRLAKLASGANHTP